MSQTRMGIEPASMKQEWGSEGEQDAGAGGKEQGGREAGGKGEGGRGAKLKKGAGAEVEKRGSS